MKYFLGALFLFKFLYAHAGTGALFTLSNNSTTNGLATQISTTIPNHNYPNASIALPSNYRFSSGSCDWILNNLCMLSLDDKSARNIYLIGKPGAIPTTLCLNGLGQLNCQNFKIQSVPEMIVAGTQTDPSNPDDDTYFFGIYNLINGYNFSNSNIISPDYTNIVGEFKAASCINNGSFCMVAGFLNTSSPYQLKSVISFDQGATWQDIPNPPNPDNLDSAQIWALTCSETSQLCVATGQVSPSSDGNTAYVWIFDVASQTWIDSSYINLNQSYGSLNLTAAACYRWHDKTRCPLAGYTNAGTSSSHLPLTVLLELDSQKHISSLQITTPTDMPMYNGETYFPAFYGVSCANNGLHCVVSGFAYPIDFNGNNIPATYVSSNGGLTWTLSDVQAVMPENTYVDITSVSCANNGLNCLMGGWSHPPGDRTTASAVVYTTNNGGRSWGAPRTILASTSEDPTVRLFEVICSSTASFCVSVGSVGNANNSGVNPRTSYPYATYSYDGGQTWSLPSQLYPRAYYGNAAHTVTLVNR